MSVLDATVTSRELKQPPPNRASFTGSAKARRYPLAWLAGARREVLDRCPSERGFYAGLGLALLLTAGLSGFAGSLAVSYVLRVSIRRELLVGAIWALIIGNVDRLLMMTITSKSKLWAALPRLVLSTMVGLMIAIPLTLAIFAPEIGAQLATTVEHAIQQSTNNVDGFYGPKIAADEQQVAAIQSQEGSLQAEINQNLFLEACETGAPDCSTTHQLGVGPHAQHYAQLAATEQAQLVSMKALDQPRIAALNANVANLTASENAQGSVGISAATANTGLIAREEALADIERGHPGIQRQVWFLSAIFIALDLIPLTLKLMHIWNGDSSYEAIAASLKRRDRLFAKRIDHDINVEEARLAENAEANREVDRVHIQVDRDKRIAEYEAWYGTRSNASARVEAEPRIRSISLDDYVNSIQHHETQPVEVNRFLALGAWIGTAVIATTTAALFVLSSRFHQSASGEWLSLVMLVAASSLAAYTHGFRRAPAWALRASFALLIAGLLLPFVIIAINT
jgi:hypothetical protein